MRRSSFLLLRISGGGDQRSWWKGILEGGKAPPPPSAVPLPCKCRGGYSCRESGVEPVGLALQRRPGEQIGGERQADRALFRGDFGRALRRVAEIVARRQRHDLRLARPLEIIEPDEALADVLADGQGAVVAQDHCVFFPE